MNDTIGCLFCGSDDDWCEVTVNHCCEACRWTRGHAHGSVEQVEATLAKSLLDRMGPLYLGAIEEAAPEHIRDAFRTLAAVAEGGKSDG